MEIAVSEGAVWSGYKLMLLTVSSGSMSEFEF